MAEDTEKTTGAIKSPQDFVGGIALLAMAVVAYVLAEMPQRLGEQFPETR